MRTWIWIGLLGLPVDVSAAPGELARKLVELRAEVEEAGQGYEDALQKRKALLEPLTGRVSELEVQLAKEELRSAQLKEKLKQAKVEQAPRSKAEEWGALKDWAKRLQQLVAGGIPFRVPERTERVDAIRKRIEMQRESAITIAGDLWAVTEKELQLTKDVEYRVGKIPLKTGESEGEMARLGMAHLLFVTPKGEAGYSVRNGGRWELVAVSNAKERGEIERIVSRLKAKSANGWYEVPGLTNVLRGDMRGEVQ